MFSSCTLFAVMFKKMKLEVRGVSDVGAFGMLAADMAACLPAHGPVQFELHCLVLSFWNFTQVVAQNFYRT